jgi:hypothetical protein
MQTKSRRRHTSASRLILSLTLVVAMIRRERR